LDWTYKTLKEGRKNEGGEERKKYFYGLLGKEKKLLLLCFKVHEES